MPDRKLAIDPTPEGIVLPLRRAHKGLWSRIRDRRFATGDCTCDICGAVQPDRKALPAHEVHDFTRPGVAHLSKILFICQLCHDAIHLERTRRMAKDDYRQAVEAHYCAVNSVSATQLEQDFAATIEAGAAIRLAYPRGAKPAMDYGAYQAEADASAQRKRAGSEDEDDEDFEPFPDHECPWDVGHAD